MEIKTVKTMFDLLQILDRKHRTDRHGREQICLAYLNYVEGLLDFDSFKETLRDEVTFVSTGTEDVSWVDNFKIS